MNGNILHKYMRHLRYMHESYASLDVVELALRLALDEQASELDQLYADLEQLQTAANAEVAELRQQLTQLDIDNASLIRRNQQLADETPRSNACTSTCRAPRNEMANEVVEL